METKLALLTLLLSNLLFSSVNMCDILAGYSSTDNDSLKSVKIKDINTKEAIKSCLEAIRKNPNEPRFLYNLGRAYVSKKDYKKAIELYEQAAKRGSVDAQFLLGEMYHMGTDSIKKDYKKAMKWYGMATKQHKHPASFMMLGFMIENGQGVKRSYKDAMVLYKAAANLGDEVAAYRIGKMYEQGLGVDKDYKKAMQWYLKSAKMGDNYAQLQIGVLYDKGLGVAKDKKAAYNWYLKSAKNGNKVAQYNIGFMHYYGQGVKKNYKTAFKWLIKSARAGDRYAQSLAGEAYANGKGVKKDYSKAAYWYKKAAKKGDKFSKYMLGGMYEYGIGVKKDYKEAIKWYFDAAQDRHPISYKNIGMMYYNGKGVKKNYVLAYAWLNYAFSNGLEKSLKESSYQKAKAIFDKLESKMTPKQIALAQSINPTKILDELGKSKSKSKKSNGKGSDKKQHGVSTATAFFVNPNYLITNEHAAKGCKKIYIRDGFLKYEAEAVYKNKGYDLAILKTKENSKNIMKLEGQSKNRIGDKVITIGYPLGKILGDSIKSTTGNISALNGVNNKISNLQHTAPIQPGNSGGPLLNIKGQVIGVNVAHLRNTQNVNFAIKTSVVKMILDLNNISYTTDSNNTKKEISDIIENNRNAVVQITCIQ